MTLPSSSLLSSRACGPKILVHNRSAAIGDSYPFPQIPRRRHQYDRLLEPTQMRRCLWRCCQRSSSASSSRIESGSRQWKQQQQPHPHTHPHPQPQQPSRLRRAAADNHLIPHALLTSPAAGAADYGEYFQPHYRRRGFAGVLDEVFQFSKRDWVGLAVAGVITAQWFLTFAACLFWIPWETMPVAAFIAAIVVRTFMHTGIFITVHDAIHGTIAPSSPRTNNAIGSALSFIYASFPYDVLKESHHRHHRNPGVVDSDPDFHKSNPNVIVWFCDFMKQYATFKQLFLESVMTYFLSGLVTLITGRPYLYALTLVMLFWALPAFLSAIQLFVFGTYLPHRHADHSHHTSSSDWPIWLSFLSCYFFGYHEAHHASPSTPWFQLPAVHKAAKQNNNHSSDGGRGEAATTLAY